MNTEIISLYWEIGHSIADKQAAGWGKSIVEQLAKDIQVEFPGIKGFGFGGVPGTCSARGFEGRLRRKREGI